MEKKQSIHFIINPVSGIKRNEDLANLIEYNLDHRRYDYSYALTEARGHATQLAQQAVAKKIDIVVACGGDGTVNEVSEPLVHSKSALAIIPAGSGNGFAMHIGMGRDAQKAIHKINDSTQLCIDTCTVNGTYFLNLAGVGFDALVAYKAEHGGTKRGFGMYAQMVRKELLQYEAMQYQLQLDDEVIAGKYRLIAIANAAMYGYNFNIAPGAKLTDGLLDIVLIKDAPLLRSLLSSWRMLNKSIYKSALVEVKRCKEAKIKLDAPYYYHIDGESHTFDEMLHFKIVPQSLNIQLPKERASAV